MGAKHGQALFDRLVEHVPVRPPLRTSRVLLIAFALAILTLYAAFVLGAVYLIVRFWPNPFALGAAALLLVIAWISRPRLVHVEKESIATRATHPELHGLVAEVARMVGVEPPARIALDGGYNAWVARTGWRQRRTLSIGIPMLHALEPRSWIALLGHELAHFGNGDVRRFGIVAAAESALVGWHAVLEPTSLDEADGHSAGQLGVVLFFFLSWIPRGLLSGMVHLMWHDSQQAEYYADRLGADVGGTAASVDMLETLFESWLLEDAVHRVAQGRSQRSIMEELRHQFRTMPERARERTRRMALAEPTPLDETHPPTGLRIRMLSKRAGGSSSFALHPETAARILQETEPDTRRVEAALLREYESYSPM